MKCNNENKQRNISKYGFNLNFLLGDAIVSSVHFHFPGQVLLLYFSITTEENWKKQGKVLILEFGPTELWEIGFCCL